MGTLRRLSEFSKVRFTSFSNAVIFAGQKNHNSLFEHSSSSTGSTGQWNLNTLKFTYFEFRRRISSPEFSKF